MEFFKKKKKKGQLSVLQGAIMGFAVIAIVAVVAFLMVDKVAQQTTPGSSAANATVKVNEAMTSIVDWLPIVAIVLVGGILIFLLFRYFGGAGKGTA